MVRRAPDPAVSKVTARINRRQGVVDRYTPDYPLCGRLVVDTRQCGPRMFQTFPGKHVL